MDLQKKEKATKGRRKAPEIPEGLTRNGKYETMGFYTSRLALLHRLVARTTKQAFGRLFGITQIEWRILVQLEYRSPSKISEIYERTLIQKPQISSTLPTLMRNGYVVRIEDKQDARAPFFAITEAGIALYKEVLAVSRKRQRGLESLLTAEERAGVESAFSKLIDFYLEEEKSGGDGLFSARRP
jgi:DNA-binding MarR family transcriptional regulator